MQMADWRERMYTKKQYREKVLLKLASMDKDEYYQQCTSIINHLLNWDTWKEANSIAITIAGENEINTKEIIKMAWLAQKKVAIPKCNSIDKSMVFRVIDCFEQLETGYKGIYEPVVEGTSELKKENIDLMIVPGVVFDQKGYRIGFGGGFYDRYLASFSGVTVSLLLEEQLYSQFPINDYDIPVQYLILPNGVQAADD